ncbi:hypothetical protein OIU77_008130 [Salix suchowensis]|uniref:Uncharacterized protein n=1 Tax=Salix suchowensis TaxID=1278906 RepID=A0ABQ9AKR8_9ROSI|nr:hypothetical protein OIU77_008130 [Salix suchowensis]
MLSITLTVHTKDRPRYVFFSDQNPISYQITLRNRIKYSFFFFCLSKDERNSINKSANHFSAI